MFCYRTIFTIFFFTHSMHIGLVIEVENENRAKSLVSWVRGHFVRRKKDNLELVLRVKFRVVSIYQWLGFSI